MPIDPRILGFTNRWYAPAMATAQYVDLDDLRLRLITPVHFLATKLEAFRGRGNDDYSGSPDLEDVITVIDGRSEIVSELERSAWDVQEYVASELRRLLGVPEFLDALSGFLMPDAGSQARRPLLLQRLRALAQLK